jgi:hypothetical protein
MSNLTAEDINARVDCPMCVAIREATGRPNSICVKSVRANVLYLVCRVCGHNLTRGVNQLRPAAPIVELGTTDRQPRLSTR